MSIAKKLTAVARERGVSLIEGVLYLVIALAVIVGGIVFFQQAQLSNGVTDLSRAGVSISSQTRSLYKTQRSFGLDDITGALLKAGAVPSSFQDGNGNIVHPFGGRVYVTGNDDSFVISYLDVPEEACLRIASIDDRGQGNLGTGIEGIDFSEVTPAGTIENRDPIMGHLISSADVSAEGFPPQPSSDNTPPMSANDLAVLCEDDIDISIYFSR